MLWIIGLLFVRWCGFQSSVHTWGVKLLDGFEYLMKFYLLKNLQLIRHILLFMFLEKYIIKHIKREQLSLINALHSHQCIAVVEYWNSSSRTMATFVQRNTLDLR